MTLDRNLHTTTIAAVKATVDARLESAWRDSGVRILRSDLPFCGIRLRYQNRLLAIDEVLSTCRVKKGKTLYAEWPQQSEKSERRKRYGKGWDDEAVTERKVRGKKGEKRAEKKTLPEATKITGSNLVENSIQTAPEISGEGCVSDNQPDGNNVLEVGDRAESNGNGTQTLSEHVVNAEHDEQQAQGQGRGDRLTEEVEQDDPFAEEDDNKENEEPLQAFGPVVEERADESPAEEWSVFDESNTGLGMDFVEEVQEI